MTKAQSPLSILLAEDSPVNQSIALHMLKKLGYGAKIANNGLEALEAQERHPFDLVLMDIQMPEMDGIEATRIIRERWPQGPAIIVVTSLDLESYRERCLSAGADDIIAKPIRKDELHEAIERNMHERSQGMDEIGAVPA
ncbi:MAG: hybrid sensory histidine kinase BarA [Methanosaeta sp. PtaU1.Bin060]|nr:MAG: hybrid sensory histidine kinase BarA [Methanosaeta sp. PtaU1.Bin060]